MTHERPTAETPLPSSSADCGCQEGAATALIATGVYALWASVASPLSTVQTVLVGIAVFLAAAGAGKIAGRRAARRRLRRALESLARHSMTGS